MGVEHASTDREHEEAAALEKELEKERERRRRAEDDLRSAKNTPFPLSCSRFSRSDTLWCVLTLRMRRDLVEDMDELAGNSDKSNLEAERAKRLRFLSIMYRVLYTVFLSRETVRGERDRERHRQCTRV